MKILFLFSCLFLVCSCNKNDDLTIATITNKSEIKIENSNISFEIDKETLTNTEATFIITNNNDESIYYNGCFDIEKEKDGTWYELKQINNVGCFPEQEVKINPHELQQMKVSHWTLKYGELTKGKYSLIKQVRFESKKFIFISAEFEIK